MTHISVLFIYITKFFVQANQHTTNRVSRPICYVMVMHTEAVSSKRMVLFSILPNHLSLIRNSLFYTYPVQSVRCDRKLSFIESNRYLLAVNDS